MYGEPAHPILRALESLELSPADDEGFCAALKAVEGTPPGG